MQRSEFGDAYEDKKRIGEEIVSSPIADLGFRDPIQVEIGTSVMAAVKAMNDNHIGCVLVMERGDVAGIFTERDVLTRVVFHDDNHALKVEQVMTPKPETIDPMATVAYALNMMSEGGYRHIPVVDEFGEVKGIVSVRNIVDFLVDLFPAAVHNLPPSPREEIPRTVDGG